MTELSADIYCDETGKKWSAVIREHPNDGKPMAAYNDRVKK